MEHLNKSKQEQEFSRQPDKRTRNAGQRNRMNRAVDPVQAKTTKKKKKKNGALTDVVQQKMENAFGEDFSSVNIKTNSSEAKDMGALAFTQGENVHFAPGQFDTNSTKGQELIGHELTHVVQQREGRAQKKKQAKPQNEGQQINDDPQLEAEADEMGKRAVTGVKSVIQKKAKDSEESTEEEKPYNKDASIYEVKKDDKSLIEIVRSLFPLEGTGEGYDKKVADIVNSVLIMNNLPSPNAISEGMQIKIPKINVHKNVTESGVQYSGMMQEQSISNMGSIPVLGWESHKGVLDGKLHRNIIIAPSKSQWVTYFKNGKLDNPTGLKYYTNGFLSLATNSSDLKIANNENEEGYLIDRRPNLNECFALIEALFDTNVDLIDHWGEYAEIGSGTLPTTLALDPFQKFLKMYLPLYIQKDASRYMGNENPESIDSHFSFDNISALADQSFTGAGHKQVMTGALEGAYTALSQGMMKVAVNDEIHRSEDHNVLEDQFKIGEKMIGSSSRIIKGFLQEYDKHIALQQNIVNSALSSIPLPSSKVISFVKPYIQKELVKWIAVPGKYANYESQMNKLIEEVGNTLDYWRSQGVISLHGDSHIRSFIAFEK